MNWLMILCNDCKIIARLLNLYKQGEVMHLRLHANPCSYLPSWFLVRTLNIKLNYIITVHDNVKYDVVVSVWFNFNLFQLKSSEKSTNRTNTNIKHFKNTQTLNFNIYIENEALITVARNKYETIQGGVHSALSTKHWNVTRCIQYAWSGHHLRCIVKHNNRD